MADARTANAIGIVPAPANGELHLLAGQLHVGSGRVRVRTLLGSCVAVTLWAPAKRAGGMCHFLLPSRRHQPGQPLDGRFGEEALHLMVEALRQRGVKPAECEAHLYGGADTMPDKTGIKFNVGERNIEHGWALIEHHGFQLANVDVGDNVPRSVTMDLGTGEVLVRRGAPAGKLAA